MRDATELEARPNRSAFGAAQLWWHEEVKKKVAGMAVVGAKLSRWCAEARLKKSVATSSRLKRAA
jgi:hypothetical protein